MGGFGGDVCVYDFFRCRVGVGFVCGRTLGLVLVLVCLVDVSVVLGGGCVSGVVFLWAACM